MGYVNADIKRVGFGTSMKELRANAAHDVMKKARGPHDNAPDDHEHVTGDMLSPALSGHNPPYVSNSTGTVILSINGTPTLPLELNITVDSGTSADNSSVSNLDLEREFYRSYDPAIGLHTAAVLGGILVWLVLYVIYRTKIRKCVIRLVKKKLLVEEDEISSKKLSDSEDKDSSSGTNPNMVRPFINPSIIIETTPPESLAQTPNVYNNTSGPCDCIGPYSIQSGCGNDDGTVFQFPYTGGPQAKLHIYHQQFCQEQQHACTQHDNYFHQLPKSEMDIPTATAQWVQNMPLAARSHQDFAGLMLAMQSRGLLAMNKPCSCPLVCPRSPQPLPLLDLPNTWNKSLPVLSNSLSSQLLSAYETATGSYNKHKDIKDIINAKRKLNKNKQEKQNARDYIEYTKLEEKYSPEKSDSNVGEAQSGFRNKTSKRLNKTPPNLTIRIPDATESSALLSGTDPNRSAVPIPVTPTVMIQNPNCRRHTGCDSNTSVSSSSSLDLNPSQRHMTIPNYRNIPSPHLLSPACENRRKGSNCHFSWSREDVNRYRSRHELQRSGSASPHSHLRDHRHQCSFSNSGHSDPKSECSNKRHNSWTGSDSVAYAGVQNAPRNTACKHQNAENAKHHKRTLSDYNRYYADLMTPSSPSPTNKHRRSLSADVAYMLNLQREVCSPTYSNGSNKNSLGTSSYSHSPSPHLLQVPDYNNLLRPITPEVVITNNNCQSPVDANGSQNAVRHCVHSDSNIAYFGGLMCPGFQSVENPIVRRHSTYVPTTGDLTLSCCAENSVRATSSFGSGNSYSSSQYPHQHGANPHSSHPYRHEPHQPHHHHHHHHSTGTLPNDAQNRSYNAQCLRHAPANLNRSYSAVVMETKL
ncbi:uncharacterized protein LOC131946278 [Physella acuta]|uniref:uncharacterized protein LOC131946278 n=1 Tax=Physella acuta TaxID=109671 RepID=UPI0027DD184B|nr:uncharacterized protein LOC131946278 [Physella acuta]